MAGLTSRSTVPIIIHLFMYEIHFYKWKWNDTRLDQIIQTLVDLVATMVIYTDYLEKYIDSLTMNRNISRIVLRFMSVCARHYFHKRTESRNTLFYRSLCWLWSHPLPGFSFREPIRSRKQGPWLYKKYNIQAALDKGGWRSKERILVDFSLLLSWLLN